MTISIPENEANEITDYIDKFLHFHSDEAYYNIQKVLENIEFFEPGPNGLPELICKLLEEEKFIRPEEISKVIVSLLKFDPIIKDVFSKISAGKLLGSLQEIIVDLSNVPLLLKLMTVAPLSNSQYFNIEVGLKNIRSAILLSICKIKNNPETLTFQIALSLQCFINEYLYDQTDEEIEALKKLENLVENKLTDGQQPSPTELACLTSYKPLHQYSWLHLLSMPVELEALQRRQILEPEEEKQLRSTIPILQGIKNNVSCKVQELYEQDPHPRLLSFRLPPAPKSFSVIIKELNLRTSNLDIVEVDAPQILIAGCGTWQSITTATKFKNCDVLAIDLSLSSLAFAKRKTKELGISNIDYMQADILDLETLNRKFDIIISTGVLHHMDDPMAGWKVLTNCLKAGGFMQIGLYSELARKYVVQIRDEIEQSNIEITSYDAIKLFRKKIFSSEEKHHKWIVGSSNFYKMSTLRDWLFHVQEHRFTIPQIEASLTQLGLMFCGFENGEIIQKFKESKKFAESSVYDLEKWDTFEKENPKEFSKMYIFWCQK